MTVKFILERETKGALRFAEVNDDGCIIEGAENYKIGTLYVRKHAFKAPFPQAMVIQVEAK